MTPTVELSYLTHEQQRLVYGVMDYEQVSLSIAQAMKIRKLAKKGNLDFEILDNLLKQEKGIQHERIFFNKEKIISVLPKELIKRDKRYIEEYIINAIKVFKCYNKK